MRFSFSSLSTKEKMEPFMACRICLNTDAKLYNMSRYHLQSTYEDLCGNNLRNSQLGIMLPHVCSYCAALLNKFAQFKEKCEQAKHVMEFLLAEHLQLTTEHIRKLNKIEANIAHPYKIKIIETIDSLTDIKEEENYEIETVQKGTSNYTDYEFDQDGTNDYTETDQNCTNYYNEFDSKEFLDIEYTDIKSDSDDEPLSKKVKCVKEKTKNDSKSKGNEVDLSVKWQSPDFELILLTKKQQLEEVLARKQSSNYLNSVYKCEYCFKGFMTEVTFKNHMVRHDVASGPEVCDVCQSRWADARALRAHAQVSHARRYVCRLCNHTDKSHHKAKEHLKWHKGYLFACKLCGATFSKSTTYLTHTRLQHPSTAACDACGDHFLGQNGLNMHKKKAHRNMETSIKYLDCEICGSKFRSGDALSRHQQLAVDQTCDTKLRHCEHCGDSLHDEDSLKAHLVMHQRVDAVRTCSGCARTFANERTLATHIARSHGAGASAATHARDNTKHQVCEICGYTCISRASLVYHQRTHTGEKPFECTICPKKFSVYQRLQIHIRTHTGERPFKCSQCPKAFKHKAALNRHDRVHTGARPYRCSTCGKAFSQSNSMKQHAASVHLKAPLYARKTKQIHHDLNT